MKRYEAKGAARRALIDGTTRGLSVGRSSAERHLWGEWEVLSREEAIARARENVGAGSKTIGGWVTTLWLNKRYLVMVAPREGGVTQLLVQRTDGQAKRNWHDLQAIKNEIAGPERVAVEVFPADSQLVDGAHVTHLWVLPEDFALPVRREWV